MKFRFQDVTKQLVIKLKMFSHVQEFQLDFSSLNQVLPNPVNDTIFRL